MKVDRELKITCGSFGNDDFRSIITAGCTSMSACPPFPDSICTNSTGSSVTPVLSLPPFPNGSPSSWNSGRPSGYSKQQRRPLLNYSWAPRFPKMRHATIPASPRAQAPRDLAGGAFPVYYNYYLKGTVMTQRVRHIWARAGQHVKVHRRRPRRQCGP